MSQIATSKHTKQQFTKLGKRDQSTIIVRDLTPIIN